MASGHASMNCATSDDAFSRSMAASSCRPTRLTLIESDELMQRRPWRRQAVAVRRADLSDIEVAARVDRDPVRCEEHAVGLGRAPLREDGAGRVTDSDARRQAVLDDVLRAGRALHCAAKLGCVVVAVATAHDVVRTVHARPRADELAAGAEDLRPLVLAGCDAHRA